MVGKGRDFKPRQSKKGNYGFYYKEKKASYKVGVGIGSNRKNCSRALLVSCETVQMFSP